MKKRILSCFMVLALCLTLLEGQPAEAKQESQSAEAGSRRISLRKRSRRISLRKRSRRISLRNRKNSRRILPQSRTRPWPPCRR